MVNENSRTLVIKSLRRINMKINIKCLAWYLVHHIPPINGNSTNSNSNSCGHLPNTDASSFWLKYNFLCETFSSKSTHPDSAEAGIAEGAELLRICWVSPPASSLPPLWWA